MRNVIGAALLFVILAFANQAMAGKLTLSDFTGTDDPVTNGLMVALNVGILIDWGQTNYAADRFDGTPGKTRLKETNPQLSTYPNDDEVNRIMLINLAAYNAAGYFIPENIQLFGKDVPAKKIFYLISTVYRYDAVINNHNLGLHIDFH